MFSLPKAPQTGFVHARLPRTINFRTVLGSGRSGHVRLWCEEEEALKCASLRSTQASAVCWEPAGPLCSSRPSLRCEELDSSKPPAAALTSVHRPQPIRAQIREPRQIRPLGDLFKGSRWRAGDKSQPPKTSSAASTLFSLLALIS